MNIDHMRGKDVKWHGEWLQNTRKAGIFFYPFLSNWHTGQHSWAFPFTLFGIVLHLFRVHLFCLGDFIYSFRNHLSRFDYVPGINHTFSTLEVCIVSVLLCRAKVSKQINKNIPDRIRPSPEDSYEVVSGGKEYFT